MFRSFASAYRIVCDLELWYGTTYMGFDFKSHSSASTQRIFCDLGVPQFRFRTRNILWIEVQQFCFRTQNNLWLEVQQFCTIYCDLNFRSSASARKTRKDVILISTLLFLHEKITFLWKIHSHSTTHPFMMDPMKDRETKESGCYWGQRNKEIGMLLTKVIVNIWLREA